jgi:hypothetical protein
LELYLSRKLYVQKDNLYKLDRYVNGLFTETKDGIVNLHKRVSDTDENISFRIHGNEQKFEKATK